MKDNGFEQSEVNIHLTVLAILGYFQLMLTLNYPKIVRWIFDLRKKYNINSFREGWVKKKKNLERSRSCVCIYIYC